MTVPLGIEQPDYALTGDPEGERRSNNRIKVYNQEEIEGVRLVCKLAREVLDIAAAALKPGITGEEIDKIVYNACIERNSYPYVFLCRYLSLFLLSNFSYSTSVTKLLCIYQLYCKCFTLNLAIYL